MILLNTMFIKYLIDTDLQIDKQLKLSQIIKYNKLAMLRSDCNMNYSYKKYAFAALLVSQNDTSLNIYNRFDKSANNKLVSPNFIMNLIHKYWEEIIFLSKPDLISNKYVNQLKSDGIATYKKQYKKFLFHFSKALITGRIQASLYSDQDLNILSSKQDIRYVWRKGINFSFPQTFPNFILNKRDPSFPNKSQISLIEQLKKSPLPIFTVTNNFNQIIIAEPSDELINNKTLLDKFYQWYDDNFLWGKDQKPVYESLFFINPEDALEYGNYIKYKYSSKNNINHLQVFPSSLDFYYRLVRTSPPRVHFRLIPDLKEIGNLLYKYRFNNNVYFHKKQKKGHDYFQGQPIYIVQPVLTKNKQNKKIEELNYSYNLNKNTKNNFVIFTNYQVLLTAWKKFVRQHSNYVLPMRPKVIVYNLEDFLKGHENSKDLDKLNILFVPNNDSYDFMKTNKINKSNNNMSKIIISNLLSLKMMGQRVIWSLTSRQPIKW
uniref:Uncharacterized protein n=1 Tax=Leiomenia cribrosa TaxID=217483 RepID=A0A4D6WU32_9FLOR|nr:hypothetical protein [Leiomenia cribrosa]